MPYIKCTSLAVAVHGLYGCSVHNVYGYKLKWVYARIYVTYRNCTFDAYTTRWPTDYAIHTAVSGWLNEGEWLINSRREWLGLSGQLSVSGQRRVVN